MTFDEIKRAGITNGQLLRRFAPIDLVERMDVVIKFGLFVSIGEKYAIGKSIAQIEKMNDSVINSKVLIVMSLVHIDASNALGAIERFFNVRIANI